MSYVLGILGCAVLFALFGLVRPSHRCAGKCGECGAACPLSDGGASWLT